MSRLVSSAQALWYEIRDMPAPVFARKLEFSFYFAFSILALLYLILPFVLPVKLAPLLISAAFSIIYCILMRFFRFKIHVHFGLMIHTGIFLILLSTIFFETKMSKAATIMVVIGVLCIAIVLVFCSLGRNVIIDEPVLQEARQRQPIDGHDNPVHPNGHVIPVLDNIEFDVPHMQVNGHAVPVREGPDDLDLPEEIPDQEAEDLDEPVEQPGANDRNVQEPAEPRVQEEDPVQPAEQPDAVGRDEEPVR